MIIRKHDLPLVQQCRALKIHRTTIYREPKAVNQDQLDLMKLIDTIHLDEPSVNTGRKIPKSSVEISPVLQPILRMAALSSGVLRP